jgi:hypothetical protein
MAQTTKTTNLRLSAGFLTVATDKNPQDDGMLKGFPPYQTFEKHNFDKEFKIMSFLKLIAEFAIFYLTNVMTNITMSMTPYILQKI